MRHREPRRSAQTDAVLNVLRAGPSYGFAIMQATGLDSGTVYPILARLTKRGWTTCTDTPTHHLGPRYGTRRGNRHIYALTNQAPEGPTMQPTGLNDPTEQSTADVIAEALWRYQRDRELQSMGRVLRDVIILVGHDLWQELRAQRELNQPGGHWHCTTGTDLTCTGMPVFQAAYPLVNGLRGWRFVLDTPVTGQAGS